MTAYMHDADLARELIRRLNVLLSDDAVRRDISRLLQTRVACSQATIDHPTIQARKSAVDSDGVPTVATEPGTLSTIGLLNGIIGALPEGHTMAGWGHLGANFDEGGLVTDFRLTYRSDP
jgi:hypothetical protein